MPWFHLCNHGILHIQYAMETEWTGPLMGFSDFRYVTTSARFRITPLAINSSISLFLSLPVLKIISSILSAETLDKSKTSLKILTIGTQSNIYAT